MNIDTKNNIPFYGRCPELRAGRDVCRVVKNQFPSYSLSMLNKRIDNMHQKGYLTGEKYDKAVSWLMQKIQFKDSSIKEQLTHSDYKLYIDLMKYIKDTKIADCGNLADLTSFILKLNGYNAATAELYKNIDGSIDHAVCVFNKDNSPVKAITRRTIILDAWLGECDFAKSVLKKYKEVYNGYFKEHGLLGPEEEFIYLKPEERVIALRSPYSIRLDDEVISKLRKKFPKLLIKDSKYEKQSQSKILKIFNLIKHKISEFCNICNPS